MPNETENGTLEIIETSALEAIERANVDLQISTARKYPRSLTVVKRRMMDLATLDEETAESCFYKLNRQGKSIEGPSIRLAEIAASSFGNLRYGARVISNDGKTITAQGFCHDLETNVLSTIETRRRITDKSGRTYSDDMQVVTGNAACAIAARNAIFKVVPFAFVKPIFLAAKQTAVGDITTLAERRTKMLSKFAALGVNEARVCASVGKTGVEEIGLTELETLIGVYNAIRDGDQTVDEAFPVPPKSSEKIKFGEAIPPAEEKSGADAASRENAGADEGLHASASESTSEELPSADDQKKKPAPPKATPLEGLRNLIKGANFDEPSFLEAAFDKGVLTVKHKSLDKLPVITLKMLIEKFTDIAGIE